MDSASIFRAGATAQKQFSMDRGFQILKVASNAPDVIRVSFPPEDITNFMGNPFFDGSSRGSCFRLSDRF